MKTALVTHPSCSLHDPGWGHPESPERLKSILEAVEDLPLLRLPAPEASFDHLALVHIPSYIHQTLKAIPSVGYYAFTSDTIVSPQSKSAALHAAGALITAVDWSMEETDRAVFCAVRPPGHHALPDYAMGFCLFNNIVIGAKYALETHGLERVAIVDFDVHHGNGTQAMVENEPQILYISTHQIPLFPGTGLAVETGRYHNILNLPLDPFDGSDRFRDYFERRVFPALEDFKPQLLLLSAGFDAHIDDPLANIRLLEEDFAWVSDQLIQKARDLCHGRLISTLEGGYDLNALAKSCRVHLHSLLNG